MQQYLIIAHDNADALAQRLIVRPQHLENIKKLKANGNFVFAGAQLNDEQQMVGSALVLQFETPQDLEEYLNTEPYVVENIWEFCKAVPFKAADI